MESSIRRASNLSPQRTHRRKLDRAEVLRHNLERRYRIENNKVTRQEEERIAAQAKAVRARQEIEEESSASEESEAEGGAPATTISEPLPAPPPAISAPLPTTTIDPASPNVAPIVEPIVAPTSTSTAPALVLPAAQPQPTVDVNNAANDIPAPIIIPGSRTTLTPLIPAASRLPPGGFFTTVPNANPLAPVDVPAPSAVPKGSLVSAPYDVAVETPDSIGTPIVEQEVQQPPPAEVESESSDDAEDSASEDEDDHAHPPASSEQAGVSAIGGATNDASSLSGTAQLVTSGSKLDRLADHPGAIAAVVFGTLFAVSVISFLVWRLWHRRQRRRAELESEYDIDPDGVKVLAPKSDIRIMDEAMAAFYAADGAGRAPTQYSASVVSGYRKSQRGGPRPPSNTGSAGWLTRQVDRLAQTITSAPPPERPRPRPKEAAVAKWMAQHDTFMLDPLRARASMVSSAAISIGTAPSISPASVVGGQRESVLSEMAQIRRDAVPPPLDVAMVTRVRRIHEEETARENARAMSGSTLATSQAPRAAHLGPMRAVETSSTVTPSQAATESTWNTWGVEQHPRPDLSRNKSTSSSRYSAHR